MSLFILLLSSADFLYVLIISVIAGGLTFGAISLAFELYYRYRNAEDFLSVDISILLYPVNGFVHLLFSIFLLNIQSVSSVNFFLYIRVVKTLHFQF